MKISIIEPQCKSWQHEMVNAGFIQQLQAISKDFAFWGEKEHIACLKKYVYDFNAKPIKLPQNFDNELSQVEFYKDLLENIINGSLCKTLFLLSSHRGNIRAVRELASKHPNVHFFIVLHGIIEQLYWNWTDEEVAMAKVLKEEIEQTANIDNVKFIIYQPDAKHFLYDLFDEKTIKKIIFMHLTYFLSPILSLNYSSEYMKIALIGASVNKSAEMIISMANRTENRCRFMAMCYRYQMPYYSNLNVIKGGSPLSRSELLHNLKDNNFVLLPYNRNKYRICTSGVFFDAIFNGIPLLMLDSPSLKFYNDRFDLGWIFSTEEELVKFCEMSFVSEHDWNRKIANICKARDSILHENLECLLGFCT